MDVCFKAVEFCTMKKIAILQSNYIPWKGYFDMIAAVDEFTLYDDGQFTKNDAGITVTRSKHRIGRMRIEAMAIRKQVLSKNSYWEIKWLDRLIEKGNAVHDGKTCQWLYNDIAWKLDALLF